MLLAPLANIFTILNRSVIITGRHTMEAIVIYYFFKKFIILSFLSLKLRHGLCSKSIEMVRLKRRSL